MSLRAMKLFRLDERKKARDTLIASVNQGDVYDLSAANRFFARRPTIKWFTGYQK